jgi:hypothetical protein
MHTHTQDEGVRMRFEFVVSWIPYVYLDTPWKIEVAIGEQLAKHNGHVVMTNNNTIDIWIQLRDFFHILDMINYVVSVRPGTLGLITIWYGTHSYVMTMKREGLEIGWK